MIRAERDKKYGNIYAEEKTDQRWVGDLGEIAVNELFNMMNEKETIWHLDEVTGKPDFTFFDLTLDVKTVKRKVPMRTDYLAQISAKHAKTPMDYIVFSCYEYPKQKMHILGAMTKHDFLIQAKYFAAGDKVHENYTIRAGHEIYAVYVKDMIPFRDFVRQARDQFVKRKFSE